MIIHQTPRFRVQGVFTAMAALVLGAPPTSAQGNGWRTLEIETSEVTGADVTLSPDGTRLVFTLLGHLFSLPVEGGQAEQVTFGPHQNRDPAFFPDGNRLAFSSNRDGSDGNIFVLDLATGAIRQLTHEQEAIRPAIAPDGASIAYIHLLARGHHCPEGPAMLRRVPVAGGGPRSVPLPSASYRSVFYLPEGGLAWAEHVRGTANDHADDRTRVRMLVERDSVAGLRTIGGIADRTAPHPGGTGLFIRARSGSWVPEFLSLIDLDGDRRRDVTSLSPQSCFRGSGAFAVASDGGTVYLGDVGRLWKISLEEATREPIPFRARVRLEVRDPTPAPAIRAPMAGETFSARSVQTPVLSPDGSSLVFGATGSLWLQDLATGEARRLLDGDGFQRDPVFSPGGERLLFVWSDGWRQELRTLELGTDRVDVLAAGSTYWHPAWSPDGRRVVVAEATPQTGPHLRLIDLAEQRVTTLPVPGLDDWSAHPQFTADGRSVLLAAAPEGVPAVYRVAIDDPTNPSRVTPLDFGHAHRPTVSPDGGWLAFRHNTEIWLAQLRSGALVEGSVRRLSEEGGDSFAFAPDGRSITYSVGHRMWRHPIAEGTRSELPVRLDFRRPVHEPLLIERVRVLDFSRGRFGPETSVYIERGRIRAIGEVDVGELPAQVRRIDGGGRFAIPGLFEMHGHAQRAFHGGWLAYGITSLRDAGGPLGWVATLADRGDAGLSDLPRLFFSGDILHGVSSTRDPIMIADPDEARRAVGQWRRRGVHFIKTHPGLRWDVQQALVDEAHIVGLPVVEHAYPLDYLYQSVTVGGFSLEHTYGGFRYQEDVLGLLAASGTRFTPTLALTTAPAVAVIEDPERWVDEKLRAFASGDEVRDMLGYGMSDDPRVLQGFWRGTRLEVRAGWDRGIHFLAGTDAPAWMVIPGASLHQELAAFADAGVPPLDVLRLATLDAAGALGVDGWSGSLEIGKVADILLLDADPLEEIRNVGAIWRVISDGSVVDPDDLRPRP